MLQVRCIKFAKIGVFVICIFTHKDIIFDSVVLIRGNAGQRKPVFWYNLCSYMEHFCFCLNFTLGYMKWNFMQNLANANPLGVHNLKNNW